MNYKYRRNQIFGKRLQVPKTILNKVYSCTLSFPEYIEYNLEDKIPLSCLLELDRAIVLKFGLHRAKKLDWETLNLIRYELPCSPKEMLLEFDRDVEDLNLALYQKLKDILRPNDYTPTMKSLYQDSFIAESTDVPEKISYLFNNARLDLEGIITRWDVFKNKDLSACLRNDPNNTHQLTDSQIKSFMEEFETAASLVIKVKNIYDFIWEIQQIDEKEEKEKYLREFAEEALSRINPDKRDYREPIKASGDEYEFIFQYISLEDYLRKISPYRNSDIEKLMRELSILPKGYIFHTTIPFSVLEDQNALDFILIYGLKNVVDFDNECGHFFSKNHCEMLKLMYDMYLHYAGNEHDPERTIYTKRTHDDHGMYIDFPYTKDEFYEAMRRMIIYGPTDWNYNDKAPDYRDMTGEFRKRNHTLFIDENAPEELKKLFYTKSLTPGVIKEHPEYIHYIQGKDLSSCFVARYIQKEGSKSYYGYENLYSFLSSKMSFQELMDFIVDYHGVFDFLYSREIHDENRFQLRFTQNDNLLQIEEKIHQCMYYALLEKRKAYPADIPQSFRDAYPQLFIDENAPEELKDAFYSRTISPEMIQDHPDFMPYLKHLDLEFLYPYMPVRVKTDGYYWDSVNLIKLIKDDFGDESFNTLIEYGSYLSKVYAINALGNDILPKNPTKEDLLHLFDQSFYNAILDGKLIYGEDIPKRFQETHPSLFAPEHADSEFKQKFYQRKFSVKDFLDHPELIDSFENTNIICGLPEHFAWMIPIFQEEKDARVANYNRLKLLMAYSSIHDFQLQNAFRDYVIHYGDVINIDKIEFITDVLARLSLSNSSEIYTFRKELAVQILHSDNPLESLEKIEDIFIHNNIPTVGKIYSCFEILHPNFKGFNFENSQVSPSLQKSSNSVRRTIIFSDLIKASFGSNNRSTLSYLEDIEKGSILYYHILNGEKLDTFTLEEQDEVHRFHDRLITLYNNTSIGQTDKKFVSGGSIEEDFYRLREAFSLDGSFDYKIEDRIIRIFCGMAGISTLQEAKQYIHTKVSNADWRNREAAKNDMTLHKGDFIKGIGGISYLRNILQNGSVAKEFLGSSATSDSTPLDTDVSMILSDEGTIREKIQLTAASGYGPIWFVLKGDNRFQCTRSHDGKEVETKRDLSRLEVFHTGVLGSDHYGIRTGFASSEIDYIVMDSYDPRVGLEIAMNGFYIPVANKDGKIIFTPEEYDQLREKMSGLSYYREEEFHFSPNLVTPEVSEIATHIDESNLQVQEKRQKINQMIQEVLQELGYSLKTKIDGDLSSGVVELIDTGSTGRGTNKPGDGDFDFMMRLDRTILSNPTKLNELKNRLLTKFHYSSGGVIGSGDFRLKEVPLDEDTTVDIDITFTEKTDKVAYSTDMSLQDRLATIKKQDPEKYNYVIANILLAKRVLKDAHVYKPNRGDHPEGGLGGVGIENWILQHGGSFLDAAKSFVEIAKDKSFEEFVKAYSVWDFGDNHLAEKRGHYPHDEFVRSNMSEAGYQKMVECLIQYINKCEKKSSKIEQIII